MHDKSYELMSDMLKRANGDNLSVLDIGSLDINGTYKPMIENRGWTYTGLDMQPGPNVDVVAVKPNKFPFNAGEFDLVLCGNMLHCVERPFKFVPELVRVLRPGGLLALVTIWRWGRNDYPVDCFRYLPRGLEVLLEDTGKLISIESGMDDDGNSWISGIKE